MFPGASAEHGGYIDFHYNNSSADYTSRIIEGASGTLSINGSSFATSVVTLPATTMSGNLTINKTGGRVVVNNGTNNFWFGTNSSGTAWGIYDATNEKYVVACNGTKVYSGFPIYGAVWNDYAEFRNYKDSDEIPYGRVVIENGDDTLSLSTQRLQKGGNICSDTFGFAIGETENTKMPIAVSGRALVYTNEERTSYEPGDAVCTGPNGTVSKMTHEEIKEYPDRIIGYVSAIPDYETWGENDIKVNERIWIKVQ